MERHENMALLTMSLFTIVLIWKMARRFQMPAQELALTRALSVVGVAGILWTGVLGGRLAFEHAAGIPTSALQAEIHNRMAGHAHEEGAAHEHGMADTMADTTKVAPHVDPPGTPPHKH
jgi:hypothetical protein